MTGPTHPSPMAHPSPIVPPSAPPVLRSRRRSAARSIAGSRHVRLFVPCMLAGLTLAVITGPSGSSTAPTSGFSASLAFPRVLWFLGVGLAVFVVRELAWAFGPSVRAFARGRRQALLARLRVSGLRLLLEAALVGVGFLYVELLSPHDTWKGGFCIQLGLALLVLEGALAARAKFGPRAGRVVGYAALAAYGLLARLDGSVARYLNRINVVLHNPVLGHVLLLGAALCLIGELIAYLSSLATPHLVRRAWRRPVAIVGLVALVYGWLTWTEWTQWQASASGSLARWLSSRTHLLVHDRTGGVIVMLVGLALVLAVATSVVIELLKARGEAGSSRAEQLRALQAQLHAPSGHVGRAALVITAMLLALEWPLHMSGPSLSNVDTQIMPFVLMALGLNVVIGFAGLLDLGYVAFYAIGAYTAAYFTGALSAKPPFVLDSLWVIPLAIFAAMLAGVLLGTPTLRLRGDYLAIVTLGFGEIIYIFANNLSFTGGPAGIPGSVPPFTFRLLTPILKGGEQWSAITYLPSYYLILGVVVVGMLVFNAVNHSRIGRSWAAIREDEHAASSLGINPLKYKVMAFAIGASTGGAAGVFLASQTGTIFPTTFILQVSITVVACVIFGGMGSIPGAIVGAVVIAGLPAYLQQNNYSWYNPIDFLLYLGAMLIVMMIFRPQGLIPSRRRRRELRLTEAGLGARRIGGGRDLMPDVAGPVGSEVR